MTIANGILDGSALSDLGGLEYLMTGLDLTGVADASAAIHAALLAYKRVRLPATADGQSIKATITMLPGQTLSGAGKKIWDRTSAWIGIGTLIIGGIVTSDATGAIVSDLAIDAFAGGGNGIVAVTDTTKGVRVRRCAVRANNHCYLFEKNSADNMGALINDILVEDCVSYSGPNGFVSKMRGVTFRNCFAYDVNVQAFVAVSDNINGASVYSRARDVLFDNCWGYGCQTNLRVYSRDTRSLNNANAVQPANSIYWRGGNLGECGQHGAHIGDFSAQTTAGPLGAQTLLKNEGVWIDGACIKRCGQNGILWTRLDGGGYSNLDFAENGLSSGTYTDKHLDWDVGGNVLGLAKGPVSVKGAAAGRETLFSNRTASATLYTADLGVTLSNAGATALVALTLPPAEAGRELSFYVADVDGLRVVAAAGDTIRIGASLSAVAGRIDSTTIGSAVRLKCIDATEWVALASSGTWTVT